MRLIELQLQHKKEQKVSEAAYELASLLKQKLGNRVIGPEFPIVSKIKGLYLKNILIKLEKTKHTSQLKEDVKELLDYFTKNAKHKSVRVIVDVDPY